MPITVTGSIGGYEPHSAVLAASTNATSVKAGAGRLHGWYLFNEGADEVYLKLYDTAAVPTAGAGTPVLRIAIPANGGANAVFGDGVMFRSGIGYTATAAVADNDTAALTASEVTVNLLYR